MNSDLKHIRITLEKSLLWWLALLAIASMSLPAVFK